VLTAARAIATIMVPETRAVWQGGGKAMCGIVGISGRHPELVREMNARIAHRGPDDAGVFTDDHISLAHRRLAVIDVSAGGHQPMVHGDLTIVYNGEIYNYRDLRDELERLGETFVSDSDTEVVLRSYARWGSECLGRFNGMFAMAVYDRAKSTLLLARDRMGIKPLYYVNRGGRWMFASEIKALMPALDSIQLDTDALVDYLTYRFVPDDKTLLSGIRRIKPGHYMTVNLDTGISTHRSYWDIRYEPNSKSRDENAERVRELLRTSVRRRLVSDVPLGVYLSGGLDSSAIVGLMAEVSARPVETYTVTFGDSSLNEAKYARIVADKFNTRHHEINVEMNAVDVLPEVVRHLDEPIGDAATIPLYLMARETKKHVTVVLSGEGSDELFAGYDKYKVLYYSRFMPPIPQLSHSGMMGRLNSLFCRNEATKYRRFAAVFDDLQMSRLVTFPVSSARRFDLAQHFSTRDPLTNLLDLDIATWLPNDLFVKADKMTMAHAVELRVPFMDHELVEFAATIPPAQKMAWGKDKVVYRRAVEPLLPHTIVTRKKQGFTIPLNEWMAAGLRDYALDVFRSTDIPQLDSNTIERVALDAGRNVFTRRQFWTLLFLAAWYSETVKRKPYVQAGS